MSTSDLFEWWEWLHYDDNHEHPGILDIRDCPFCKKNAAVANRQSSGAQTAVSESSNLSGRTSI